MLAGSVLTRVLFALLVAAAVAAGGAGASSSRSAALSVREYAVPAGTHPHDVAPARGGGVWYTAQASGALGLLDQLSGKSRLIPLGAGSAPHGVIVGPDGAAWVTDGGLNAIVRVDAQPSACGAFHSRPRAATRT